MSVEFEIRVLGVVEIEELELVLADVADGTVVLESETSSAVRRFIDAFRRTSRSCFLVTNVNRSAELRFMARLAYGRQTSRTSRRQRQTETIKSNNHSNGKEGERGGREGKKGKSKKGDTAKCRDGDMTDEMDRWQKWQIHKHNQCHVGHSSITICHYSVHQCHPVAPTTLNPEHVSGN